MACASALTLSSGCASYALVRKPPPAPVDLIVCAERAGVPLPDGPWDAEQTAEMLARLVASEAEALECAEGWAAFYAALRG